MTMLPCESDPAALARTMHAESVDLWNALWREAGERLDFAQREDVETVQRILSRLGYPNGDPVEAAA